MLFGPEVESKVLELQQKVGERQKRTQHALARRQFCQVLEELHALGKQQEELGKAKAMTMMRAREAAEVR